MAQSKVTLALDTRHPEAVKARGELSPKGWRWWRASPWETEKAVVHHPPCKAQPPGWIHVAHQRCEDRVCRLSHACPLPTAPGRAGQPPHTHHPALPAPDLPTSDSTRAGGRTSPHPHTVLPCQPPDILTALSTGPLAVARHLDTRHFPEPPGGYTAGTW